MRAHNDTAESIGDERLEPAVDFWIAQNQDAIAVAGLASAQRPFHVIASAFGKNCVEGVITPVE